MKKNILAIDIGNSHTVIGLFSEGRLLFTGRSATDRKKTAEDFAITITGIFTLHRKSTDIIDQSVISSVVPEVTHSIISAAELLTGKKPIIVTPETAGIKMDVDDPRKIGTDRIADAVAASFKYPKPLIIVDLGTATTINVVNKEGVFLGGCIHPGVITSLQALSAAASQLPFINLANPGPVIAKNTTDSILSAIFYGTASMIDGVIDRIEEELGEKAFAVATGGLAQNIIGHCKKTIIHDPNLLLEGLYYIGQRLDVGSHAGNGPLADQLRIIVGNDGNDGELK